MSFISRFYCHQVRHCQEESKGLEERASLSEQHAKAFQEMLLLREEEMEADLKKATLQKRRSHEKLNLSRLAVGVVWWVG